MSVIPFPIKDRLEVFTIRDRTSGTPMHICEWVGFDNGEPFRQDVAHAYTAEELLGHIAFWNRHGVPMKDVGVSL